MKVSLWAYLREQRHCVFVRGALLYPVWTNLLNFKTSGKDGSSSSTRRELEEEEEGGVGAEEGTEGTEGMEGMGEEEEDDRTLIKTLVEDREEVGVWSYLFAVRMLQPTGPTKLYHTRTHTQNQHHHPPQTTPPNTGGGRLGQRGLHDRAH